MHRRHVGVALALVAGIAGSGTVLAAPAEAHVTTGPAVIATASPEWPAHRSLPVDVTVRQANPDNQCSAAQISLKWILAPGGRRHSTSVYRNAQAGTFAATMAVPARWLHAGNVIRYAVVAHQLCWLGSGESPYLGRSPEHGWHKVDVEGLLPSDE
jgi:hypothetical protein